MAIQSSFYTVDGSTRTFPSTKHIATKQHCAVYLKDAVLLTWSAVNVDEYSLINNSIVFDTAPSSTLYSQIEIRIVDSQGEIVNSPSDIAIVADNIASINTDALNIDAINTASANIASINSVSATVVPNIAEILLANDNASTATAQAVIATTGATNSQLRAWQAEAEKMTADSYATEAEDVFVKSYTSDGDGTFTATNTTDYSALHWSAKAEIIGSLTIDAVPIDGSTNPVSSGGVWNALDDKLNTSEITNYLQKAGGVMTGAITALRETRIAMPANDINLSAGNVFTKTISGDITLSISNWLVSGNANSFILELTNGGSAVVTWFAGVKWAGGTAPTLTASGVDILGFYSHDSGTTVRGIVLAKDSK